MSELSPSTEYEKLVAALVMRLPLFSEVTTTRIEHNVRVTGSATVNQIDVLWDFTDGAGHKQRIVFEARLYKNRIEQGALHAFRSVVDDIADPTRQVTGVMVTTVGYQAGAKRIANTYGIVVLELREPTEADLANHITAITFEFTAHFPKIANLGLEAVEIFGAEKESDAIVATLGDLTIDLSDGQRQLADVLFEGELGSFDEPSPLHPVRREFDPPVTLRRDGEAIARVRVVTATVGVRVAAPTRTTTRKLEDVAWLLRNALDRSILWFGASGRVWSTDS